MDDQQLMLVYEWIDSIPLSREKKNISRDFCDGCLTAEILKYYYPKIVDLHNYPSGSSTKQKLSNWNTLSLKVFKKIKFVINNEEINDIIHAKAKAIEKLLYRLYQFIEKHNNSAANPSNFNKNHNFNNENGNIKEELNYYDNLINELNEQKNNLENKIKNVNEGNIILKQQLDELMSNI